MLQIGADRLRRAPSRNRKHPMKNAESVIQSDPEIKGATPAFVGARVPFQTLLDYLESGQAGFLDDFPDLCAVQLATTNRYVWDYSDWE